MTFVYHLVDAPQYKGPVFLGIGDRAFFFIFTGFIHIRTPSTDIDLILGDSTFCGGQFCGSQPYALYDKFPQAMDHVIKVYPETGHLILFHHSAPALMKDTLRFLAEHGF